MWLKTCIFAKVNNCGNVTMFYCYSPMKQIFVLSICFFILVGCGNKNTTVVDAVSDTNTQEIAAEHPGEQVEDVYTKNTISFFGQTLIMDDSIHVMQQIKEIAGNDSMLLLDGKVLTVGEIGFGVNIHLPKNQEGHVALLSSIQVDDSKMKKVKRYLDGIYGMACEEEPYCYKWHAEDSNKIIYGNLIRMREVYSDEGGTWLIFH